MAPKKKEVDKNKEDEDANKPVEDTGVFVFSEKSRYSGQFVRKDGAVRRNGTGTFTDGFLEYTGEWRDDAMHGNGELKFASGASYAGSFHENAFDGSGTYRWPDGSWYTGQWRANRMHGEGIYGDSEGRQFEGRFYNGTGPGLKRQQCPQPIGAVAARVHELSSLQAHNAAGPSVAESAAAASTA